MSLVATNSEFILGVMQAQDGGLPTQFLVLFVALGLLLIILLAVVIIYFLLRKFPKDKEVQASEIPEKQEEPVKKETPAYLPFGTILNKGLYEVDELLETSSSVNVYRVKRTQPLYLCSHCQSELENDTSAFCRVCGAAFKVTPPTYPEYLMREAVDSPIFDTSEKLIDMNLKHASLLLPVEMFTDNASGSEKKYIVEPFHQKVLLSDKQPPLPLNLVLDIGIALAEGIAYLHNYGVVLNSLEPDMVVYQNDEAQWNCYGNVSLLSTEEEADYTAKSDKNTRSLSVLLEYLIVGDAESTSLPIPLPDEVNEVLHHYSNLNEDVSAANLARSLRQAKRMLGGHNEVHYRLGAKSDVGRIRKINEDSMLLRDLSADFADSGLSVVIDVVADGVGGHTAGDVASQLTISAIDNNIKDLLTNTRIMTIPDAREWISKSASSANEIVYQERTKAGNNMACTLVLAFFIGDLATILNVGDSRAYHLNERGIRQISIDHSLVERLVSIGEITREEARHHPRKSVIYRVIGDRLALDYDIFEQSFVPGEALLICSDGLSDMVEDATIWRIWRSTNSPQEAVDQLVAEANTAGGTDNITVTIVEITA
jgi:serine/threonine protein phosphatase PrpC/cbb3-type cytochrome oxidase subunit 3